MSFIDKNALSNQIKCNRSTTLKRIVIQNFVRDILDYLDYISMFEWRKAFTEE